MPLNTKIGEPARYIKDKEGICLTNDQARPIYKKLESESVVYVDTIKQEIEVDKLYENNNNNNNNNNNLEEHEINPIMK